MCDIEKQKCVITNTLIHNVCNQKVVLLLHKGPLQITTLLCTSPTISKPNSLHLETPAVHLSSVDSPHPQYQLGQQEWGPETPP